MKSEVRLLPAPERTGIIFQIKDLANQPTLPAGVKYIKETSRGTLLGAGNFQIQAVVYILSVIRFQEGVHYKDEMVRYKILDLIEALFCVGQLFIAYVIAICSGYFSNTSFVQELVNNFMVETANVN